jgi:methylenetetrahydrofolate dehydrogenase (NADP+)/methenyltetrahydrofolate cyclohydrolase
MAKIAKEMKAEFKQEVAKLKAKELSPALLSFLWVMTCLEFYVTAKERDCEDTRIFQMIIARLLKRQKTDYLIEKKNNDPKIHGMLVQLPLPKHLTNRGPSCNESGQGCGWFSSDKYRQDGNR